MMDADRGDGRELVFVYGTLRRGGSNAFRMKGASFVGSAYVAGKLYLISWYPGLVRRVRDGLVSGEVYRVGPEQLRALDEFEGLSAGEIEGSEYRRVRAECIVETRTGDDAVMVWAYEWLGPVDEEKFILSGDWLIHTLGKPRPVFTVLASLFAVLSFAAFIFLLFGRGWLRPLVEAIPAFLNLSPWLLACAGPGICLLAAIVASRRREGWVPLRWHCTGIAICQLTCVAIVALILQ